MTAMCFNPTQEGLRKACQAAERLTRGFMGRVEISAEMGHHSIVVVFVFKRPPVIIELQVEEVVVTLERPARRSAFETIGFIKTRLPQYSYPDNLQRFSMADWEFNMIMKEISMTHAKKYGADSSKVLEALSKLCKHVNRRYPARPLTIFPRLHKTGCVQVVFRYRPTHLVNVVQATSVDHVTGSSSRSNFDAADCEKRIVSGSGTSGGASGGYGASGSGRYVPYAQVVGVEQQQQRDSTPPAGDGQWSSTLPRGDSAGNTQPSQYQRQSSSFVAGVGGSGDGGVTTQTVFWSRVLPIATLMVVIMSIMVAKLW